MKVRVSNVESFRQWRQDEEADTDSILRRLRGQDEPSPLMLAGTAFHKALEQAQEGNLSTIEAHGHRFIIECEITLALPQTRELRLSKSYGPISVSGQVDILEGKRIEDHKTTGRFDAERYLDGYQYRYYLDIFDADVFRWNVFEISQIDDESFDGPTYSVYGFHQFHQYRYPGMSADCAKLAGDLYDFVRSCAPDLLEAA